MKQLRIKIGDAHIMKESEKIPDEVPEIEVVDTSCQTIKLPPLRHRALVWSAYSPYPIGWNIMGRFVPFNDSSHTTVKGDEDAEDSA